MPMTSSCWKRIWQISYSLDRKILEGLVSFVAAMKTTLISEGRLQVRMDLTHDFKIRENFLAAPLIPYSPDPSKPNMNVDEI